MGVEMATLYVPNLPYRLQVQRSARWAPSVAQLLKAPKMRAVDSATCPRGLGGPPAMTDVAHSFRAWANFSSYEGVLLAFQKT